MGLDSIISGVFGDGGSSDAIRAQKQAAAEANKTLRYMYDTQRADLQPWRQAGIEALGGLQNSDFQRDFTMSDFVADPGYNFRMNEGLKAIQASASARGGGGGGTLKSLMNYGQNMASEEYNNAYNRFNADRDRRFGRLSELAGLGSSANNTQVQASQNYGNAVAGNQIGLGNSIGAAYIGQGNRNANLLGQGATAAALAFSDERLKTNIELVSKEDLLEMKSHLRAFAFNYKNKVHGEGDWIGVMAQDLEKSKLGRTLVVHDSDGNKMIDIGKVMSLFLATMAEA